MLDHIVVPLDGSAFAEHALPPALEIARRGGGRLELFTVIETSSESTAATDLPGVPQDRAERYLAGKVRDIESRWEGTIDYTVRSGTPASSLHDRVEETGADLVVMSSHGRGGLSRVWLGSVTDSFVRRTACPVLVIRPGEPRAPQLTEPFSVQRILVPVDTSEATPTVADRIVELGLLFGAEAHLLSVILPIRLVPDEVHPYLAHAPDLDREWTQRERQTAKTRLRSLARRLSKKNLEVERSVVEDTNVASRILQAADDEDADLIAMATRGRSGLSRALLGSVADKVLRASSRPVLLTPSTPR